MPETELLPKLSTVEVQLLTPYHSKHYICQLRKRGPAYMQSAPARASGSARVEAHTTGTTRCAGT